MKNIYLTGFMGAGKTSVGIQLAQLLGSTFIDLDAVIVTNVGKPVRSIFADDGEAVFRKLETDALQHVAEKSEQVVATGGGVVISELNRNIMHESGAIVLLSANPGSVLTRLAGDSSRPLLDGESPELKVAKLLCDREPFYADSDISIVTDGKTINEIAAEIFTWVQGNV